jgi:ribosomal protein L37AE/L43A
MRLGMHHSSEHGTTLQEHRRTIDAEHNCPSCDMAFRTRQGLGQHHSRSHGVSIRDLEKQQRATHECPTCGEMLGSRNLVGIHHSEEHGETLVEHRQRSSNGVECPSCDRCDFSSEYALKQHHAKAHDRSLNEPEHRPVECEWPDCGERFDTTANMRIHHGHAHGSTRVELVCVECGEDFEVSRWAAENGQEHCSPQCSGDAQYERVTVSCDWCGDDVEKIPAEAERRDHHFCKNGEGCEDKWRSENFSGEDSPVWTERVEVTCEWCDSAFTKPRYQAKVVDMHFCDLESVDSPSCFSQWASENRVGPNHPLWDGGWFPYGPGWGEAKKELVRERDGRECRVCGKSEAAHLEEHDEKHTIHHIVKARVLQDAPAELRNGPFNLVTICRDHHLNKWEEVPVLLQFMAFLPHPPLPMEQVELAAFAAED